MSTSNRLISALFTALSGFGFFAIFLASGELGRDYWWETYLSALTGLVLSSLIFGFALPPVLRKLRLRQPWQWILVQALLAWLSAVIVLGLLNVTPMCVGQDNGDGTNNLTMCLIYTVLVSVVYTPVFVGMQAVSSMLGHWVMSQQMEKEGPI